MNTKRKFIKKTISVALTMIFLLNLGISFQSVEGSYLPSVSLSTMGVQGQQENDGENYGGGPCGYSTCSNYDNYANGYGTTNNGTDYEWHQGTGIHQDGNNYEQYTRHYFDNDGNQTSGYTVTTTTHPDGSTTTSRVDWNY